MRKSRRTPLAIAGPVGAPSTIGPGPATDSNDAAKGGASAFARRSTPTAFPRTMSGMASRTERIEARIDPDSAERIRYASALEHTSLSGFMVAAAAEKAERVIAEHAYTLVPSDYFDRLLEILDQPAEPVPELAAVARREREQPRFQRA